MKKRGLLILLVLAACSGGPQKGALPAAHTPSPIAAAPTLPVSATPAPPATVTARFPACRRARFAEKMLEYVSPETGEHAFIVQVAFAGPRPCTTRGYPKVTFWSSSGRQLPFRFRDGGGPYVTHHRPGFVNLHPGDTLFIEIAKYRCDVAGGVTARTASVSLPGASVPLQLDLRTVMSIDYCAETPSTIVYLSPLVAAEPQLYS